MSRRAKSADRRAEILRVTLDLLGEIPLARLTTRQIAEQLDITQPALFRHFRSREQLLLAVMHSARTELARIADSVLADEQNPVHRLRVLAARLLSHVERHPGLARLLFAPPEKGLLRDALRQMVSMQQSLVGQLVRDGQEAGLLRASLDPREAAMFYVGMIQGVVLRAQLADNPTRLADDVGPMLSLWLDGARAITEHLPRSDDDEAQASPQSPPEASLHALDVRPILAAGGEPFDRIMASLAMVRPTGVLTVTAPFRPTPLLRLVSERGHLVVARETAGSVWIVDIVVGGSPTIDELLDFEPPEPLERVLEMIAGLPPGTPYIARLPRRPQLLVPHLEQRQAAFEIMESVDGTALLRVETAP